MKEVHYFQRYENRENWVTNSTLLLFQRLYSYNIFKFNDFINNLLIDSQNEIEFGVTFTQQVTNERSVPDGMILQESIQILIETKLHNNFDIEQLKNHLSGFDQEIKNKLLIGLSIMPVKEELVAKIYSYIKESKSYRGIKFAGITYSSIYSSFIKALSENDYEMKEIADDYYDLCTTEKLIDFTNVYMLAFSVGLSKNENLQYGIYYDPVSRKNNIGFKYLALYDKKKIFAIGELTKIVECNYINGELELVNNAAKSMTPEEYDRVKGIICSTHYYDLTSNNKFYLVDHFYPTDFEKISYQSMRSKRYFNLLDSIELTNEDTAESISILLNGKKWE
jgi:hypothetical protein